MPIYEYACQKCGHVVEVFQKLNDKGPGKCPKCGGKLARVLSHTSFQLKGGGWYKDLYSSVKPGSESDTDSPKVETKTETTSEAKTESKADAKSESKAEAKTETAKPAAKSKPAPKASSKAKTKGKG